MENDARRISSSENEEKYPIVFTELYEEEEIHIPPSTELIPDEYDHKDNRKGLVLIFYSKLDIENKNMLVKEFKDQGYDVSNVFALTSKDFITGKLREVAQGNNEDKTCLIMFFLGTIENEDKFLLDEDDNNHVLLKDIWLNFTADNCPTLRNKPKIFVFQATKKPSVSRFDAQYFTSAPKGAYNVPSEADILLIYTRVDNCLNRGVFIRELCNKIDKFGKRDDIISLVTRTVVKERRPLTISTLTRKFYVAFNELRGHYYDLNLNHTITVKTLKDLRKNVKGKVLHESVKKTVQVDYVNNQSKSTPKVLAKTKTETRPRWK